MKSRNLPRSTGKNPARAIKARQCLLEIDKFAAAGLIQSPHQKNIGQLSQLEEEILRYSRQLIIA
jgi:hypothetical protein